MKDDPRSPFAEDQVQEFLLEVLQEIDRPEPCLVTRPPEQRSLLAEYLERFPTSRGRLEFMMLLGQYREASPDLADWFARHFPNKRAEVAFHPRWRRFVQRQTASSRKREGADHRRLRALGFGQSTLTFLSLLLPKRLANEDIGDALETMRALACQGCSSWQIVLKTVTTAFWVSLNALREISGAILGRVRAGSR